MNKTELLKSLQDEHAAMERAIAGLTPEQLAAPGVTAGGWSVQDILAHVAAWEAELVTALFEAGLGRPLSIARALENVDAWNAERLAENRARPLDRVLADWRGVRQALAGRLAAWNDAQLAREVPGRKGVSWTQLIEANSYGHEAEHRAEVEAWRQKVTG